MRASLTNGAYLRALTSSYGQIGVSLLIQVLLVPMYLDHLGTWRFGVLTMLLAVVNFAGFGLVWLSGAMQRAMGEAHATGQEGLFRLVRSVSAGIYLGYGIVVAVGAIAVAAALQAAGRLDVPTELGPDLWGAVIGTGAYFAVLSILNVDRAAFAARGRQATGNLLTILAQAGYAVGAVPVLMAGGGIGALMACFVAGAVVALAVSRWLRRSEAATEPCQTTAREVFRRLSGRLGGAYMVYGTLAACLQADVLILGLLTGGETVAKFALVWRIAEWAAVALWRVPETMIPFLVHADTLDDRTRLAELYRRLLWTAGGLSACVGLGYAAFGPWVVKLWVGAEFAPTEWWAYALAGGGIFWLGLARVPMVFGYGMVRLRRISATMAVELAARIALTVLLLPAAGYAAPVAALNLAHALGAAWSYLAAGGRLARPQGVGEGGCASAIR